VAISILMLEFKGFTRMTTQMAYDMESTGITPERIRASGISIVQEVISRAKKVSPPTNSSHIGGDTWAFEFQTLEEAVTFGWMLLRTFLGLATNQAVFFLKPSLALNMGRPKWQDGRFLDDTSIETYQVADKGRPYHFYVLGEAIGPLSDIQWVRFAPPPKNLSCKAEVRILDWQSMVPPNAPRTEAPPDIHLPSLLLDNEVLYANTPAEAVQNIIRQQSRAHSVISFGGPVPYDIPMYREYLNATFSMLRSGYPCQWTVLSYLPVFEARYSFAWLEICRWLSSNWPQSFAFAAFIIPGDQPRPFSFHIYDDEVIHIGLRSFSPQRGAPTMNSAIMFRNGRIASRFREEFMENWRRIGPLDKEKYERISSQFSCLTQEEKEEILTAVREFQEDPS